jgi:cardiolipin synthase
MELIPGNRIALLKSGAEYFPALLGAIDKAASYVRIETYIFADDSAGRSVADALTRAAGRGVAVRLVIDGFGSRELPQARIDALRGAGVAVLFYRPEVAALRFRKSRLRRLHRKITLIDGRIGFVGGINIIDDMTGIDTGLPRLDYAVHIEGPLLEGVSHAMRRLWRILGWVNPGHREKGLDFPPVLPEKSGDMPARLVVRDNLAHRRDIEEIYLGAIHQARREIIIASAYFLPGWRFRHALVDAADRGVRVVLLLQGWSDHLLFHQASRAFYEHMLDHGIEIHEYVKSEMHAKVAVIDERWATVGSSNLDPFSLVLAREANVVVEDEAFARKLRTSLEIDIMQGAQPVRRMQWKHRSFWVRFFTWIGYSYARLAMGIVGVREKWF